MIIRRSISAVAGSLDLTALGQDPNLSDTARGLMLSLLTTVAEHETDALAKRTAGGQKYSKQRIHILLAEIESAGYLSAVTEHRGTVLEVRDVPLEAHQVPPAGVCVVDGCERKRYGRIFTCQGHYVRKRNFGAVGPATFRANEREAYERFQEKVDSSGGPDSCHVWTAGTGTVGYGKFCDENGKSVGAHRWILGHLQGRPLSSEEHALHRCDNPPCVNPEHLYIGTPLENMRDRDSRGRGRYGKNRVIRC